MNCEFIENPGGKKPYKCKHCGFEWHNNTVHKNCDAFKESIVSKPGPDSITQELKPPPIGRRLLNFAKSAALHAMRGNPTCTEEEIQQRLDICKQCDLFKRYDEETGVCTHDDCGCNIKSQQKYLNKLAWKDQRCPIGKWERLDNGV